MKKILFIITFSFFRSLLCGQGLFTSQPDMQLLWYNPASAGANYKFQANLTHRQNWINESSILRTSLVNTDVRLGKKHWKKGYFGLGFLAFNDHIGSNNLIENRAQLSMAFHLYLDKLKKTTLGAGMYSAFNQRYVDVSNFRWGNQWGAQGYDASLQSKETISEPMRKWQDVGGGIFLMHRKNQSTITANNQWFVNVGLSVYYGNKPAYSFNYYERELIQERYVLALSFQKGLKNTSFTIAPQAFVMKQWQNYNYLIGSDIKWMLKDHSIYTSFENSFVLSTGLYYRNSNSLVSKVLIEYGSYALGVSFDYSWFYKDVSNQSQNVMEITLRYVSPSSFTRTSH